MSVALHQALHQGSQPEVQWLLWGSLPYYWRRQWHPTPALLPGKSHWRRSLVLFLLLRNSERMLAEERGGRGTSSGEGGGESFHDRIMCLRQLSVVCLPVQILRLVYRVSSYLIQKNKNGRRLSKSNIMALGIPHTKPQDMVNVSPP